MSKQPDPIALGIDKGWKYVDASRLTEDTQLTADVVIIGTGAGGGITAEMLTNAGLKVLMIEEGPMQSSKHFNGVEAEAYDAMYQERAGRRTKDGGITVLQGRTVGGSTTINWCASFRTPENTLAHWRDVYGLKTLSSPSMKNWLLQAERRLGIEPWKIPPNENNALLARGSKALGYSHGVIPRNVRNCANLGYCGTGCPINAKQSMLVTTIPTALKGGAQLYTRLRAQKFTFEKNSINTLECDALSEEGYVPTGKKVTIRAKHYVLAAGGINGPALLLRSQAPDPAGLLGKRSTVHPTVFSASQFEQPVNAYQGAPQSVYSDHFMNQNPLTGPLGYKLEVPPLHPILTATGTAMYGDDHAEAMRNFDKIHSIIALIRDGFHPESVGGKVELRPDGTPVLDYPITEPVWEAARRAYITAAEVQFAAGAKKVFIGHEDAKAGGYRNFAEAKADIAKLKMRTISARVGTAHLMGGCSMGGDEKKGVVDVDGRHFQIKNLSVHDGSVFPTSLGVNPQLTIYATAARMSAKLSRSLGGKVVRLA